MNRNLKLLLGGLTAALFSLAAAAQGGPAATGQQPAANCGKARDPQRCEALQKAKETCKDKTAADKRKCMSDAMPPMDCSKSRSPARCEAHQKAKETCKDKAGPEHRQCMREHLPKSGGKGGSQPPAPKS